ncbi:MAG TPA: hypothetical protein VHC43_06640 [Mycobacteriales bacterium]|nr:hypothetical protein [Mycobacteriales bacterium]
MGRKRVWPPPDIDVNEARVSYLAFRAAEPELRRRARSKEALIYRLLGNGMSRGMRPEPRRLEWREVEDEKLRRYVSACYAVAERFNGEDRNVLKLSGALPIGFWDDVEEEVRRAAAAERRKPRRS